jgi:hypothetical protein
MLRCVPYSYLILIMRPLFLLFLLFLAYSRMGDFEGTEGQRRRAYQRYVEATA